MQLIDGVRPKGFVLERLGTLIQNTEYAEQFEWEAASREEGRVRYWQGVEDAAKRGQTVETPAFASITQYLLEQYVVGVEMKHRDCVAGKTYAGCELATPIIVEVEPDKLAAIGLRVTIDAVLTAENRIVGEDGLSGMGVPQTRVAYDIGKAVVAQATHHLLAPELKEERRRMAEKQSQAKINGRSYTYHEDDELPLLRLLYCGTRKKYADRVLRAGRLRGEGFTERMVHKAYISTGAVLLDLLLKFVVFPDADGNLHIPITTCKVRTRNNRVALGIRASAPFVALISREHGKRECIRPVHRPMLVPPAAFSEDGKEQGGYLVNRTPMVSGIRPAQRRMMRAASMPLAYRAINVLNAQPWRILSALIPMQREAMSRGLQIGNLPPMFPPDKPVRPALADEDAEIEKKWKKSAVSWWDNLYEIVGRQQGHEIALNLADDLHGRTFYQPHGQDFRGRYFTHSPFLSHYQYDAIRALLLMGYDKPMTRDGERWLCIHAANMFGMDKLPMHERIMWVKNNASNICRAAKLGLNDEWWWQADKPWQFLAACMGLVDPQGVGRFIPVMRDGTFNGLQHFAAITRDPWLARKANLVPGLDRPEDQYVEIAERAREILCERGMSAIANYISRKVAKPLTMLPIYGITQYGARGNAYESLVADAKCPPQFAAMFRGEVAQACEQALGEKFAAAVNVMDFIRKCAGAVAATGNMLAYQTPLGWPVVQPYSNATMIIKTVLGYLRADDHENAVPKKGKQRSASVPTFVHSVDQTHFSLNAIECGASKLSCAGQHDAFVNQPADCEEASHITTRTFVETHEADPLGLYYEACKQVTSELPEMPQRGDWNLRECITAVYAFS